jgi:hypothetical protein
LSRPKRSPLFAQQHCAAACCNPLAVYRNPRSHGLESSHRPARFACKSTQACLEKQRGCSRRLQAVVLPCNGAASKGTLSAVWQEARIPAAPRGRPASVLSRLTVLLAPRVLAEVI